MPNLPTLRESWRRAFTRTDWHTFGWSALGAAVTGAGSVIAGVAGAVEVLVIAVASGLLVFVAQFVAKFLRAPRAIVLERLSALEHERDQFKGTVALLTQKQSDTYYLIGELLATATELALRNLPSGPLKERFRPNSPRRRWQDDVESFRARAVTELRPQIQPHEWERVFGHMVIPPSPRLKHQVDEEHGEHLRVLERHIDGLRTLMEAYATRPTGGGLGPSSPALLPPFTHGPL